MCRMSFARVRYSPAPISIKHLLDHGKASDAKVKEGDSLNHASHTTGQFLFPETRNPDPPGRDDHGATAAAPRPATTERVHRGAQ